MKYLKHFANAQEAATVLATWPFNTVSSIQGVQGASINLGVSPGPAIDYTIPFYIEDISGSANTIHIKKSKDLAPTLTIEKSTDGETWGTMGTTSVTEISATVPANGKLYLRCSATHWCTDSSYNTFNSASGKFNVGGNINSLLYGRSFNGQTDFPSGVGTFTLAYLFRDNTSIISAQQLLLPATTLAQNCYAYMFKGCTSLTSAPALPATALDLRCYANMFNGCKSLTTAPELPATTLAEGCYAYMFYGCTALTTAPTLPATTLALSCYDNMFKGCTLLTSAPALPATALAQSCYVNMFRDCKSLTTAPELPATTLAQYCYHRMFSGCTALTMAPELPATTLAQYCYYQMFSGCTALTMAPELQATTLAESCYNQMFSGCTALTMAPELPATTLAESCYNQMFSGCTNLNYIKCMATDISATNCTSSWLQSVASTGTFIKNPSMSRWTTDDNGIPPHWTVKDAA